MRAETPLWIRAFEAIKAALERNIPFLLWYRQPEISPLGFEEFVALGSQGCHIATSTLNAPGDTTATFVAVSHMPFVYEDRRIDYEASLHNRFISHLFPGSCSRVI